MWFTNDPSTNLAAQCSRWDRASDILLLRCGGGGGGVGGGGDDAAAAADSADAPATTTSFGSDIDGSKLVVAVEQYNARDYKELVWDDDLFCQDAEVGQAPWLLHPQTTNMLIRYNGNVRSFHFVFTQYIYLFYFHNNSFYYLHYVFFLLLGYVLTLLRII